METTTRIIARVNNVDIMATSEEQLIPIRPLCEALGIDPEGQRQRIERDEILSPVACMIKATGADAKSATQRHRCIWTAETSTLRRLEA